MSNASNANNVLIKETQQQNKERTRPNVVRFVSPAFNGRRVGDKTAQAITVNEVSLERS